jgi:hypothetical protein
LTFTFVDGIIFKAWREPQIAQDKLPAVPDTDKASYLLDNVIPDLDPIERKQKGMKEKGLLMSVMKIKVSLIRDQRPLLSSRGLVNSSSPMPIYNHVSDIQSQEFDYVVIGGQIVNTYLIWPHIADL